MIYIEGGRGSLYQWDIDQRLIVEHDEVTEVHFSNNLKDPALICEVYEEGGLRYANVPNILLQQPATLLVHGCCAECVRESVRLRVIPRAKPADYVYTETELLTFEKLQQRAEAAVAEAETAATQAAQSAAWAWKAEGNVQEAKDAAEAAAAKAAQSANGMLTEAYNSIFSEPVVVEWELGGLQSSDASTNTLSTRIRTGYIPTQHLWIRCSGDAEVYVYCYASPRMADYIGLCKVGDISIFTDIALDGVAPEGTKCVRLVARHKDVPAQGGTPVPDVAALGAMVTVSTMLGAIPDPYSDYQPDVPESMGVLNAILNMKQLAEVRYTPLTELPAGTVDGNHSSHFKAGVEVAGLPYGSERQNAGFVPNFVSLHTFMMAIKNPNSYLYTVDTNKEFGNLNGHTYYSTVCSVACAYALNIVPNFTTHQWKTLPGMELIEPQSVYALKLGDTICTKAEGGGHIVMVTDITRNKRGRIGQITITEAAAPRVKSTVYTPETLEAEYPLNAWDYCRYGKIHAVKHARSPYVAVEDETPQTVTYNTAIIPRKGDAANWRTDEAVEIDVLEPGTYTDVEVYKDGAAYKTIEVPGGGGGEAIDHTVYGIKWYIGGVYSTNGQPNGDNIRVRSCYIPSTNVYTILPSEDMEIVGYFYYDDTLTYISYNVTPQPPENAAFTVIVVKRSDNTEIANAAAFTESVIVATSDDSTDVPIAFERGTITSADGSAADRVNRARSGYLPLRNLRFSCKEVAKYTVYFFDANKSYIVHSIGWQNGTLDVLSVAPEGAKYIRIVVAYDDDRDVVVDVQGKLRDPDVVVYATILESNGDGLITLSDLTPGSYQARLTDGTNTSDWCSWITTDISSEVSATGKAGEIKVKISHSDNAEPLFVAWCNATHKGTVHISTFEASDIKTDTDGSKYVVCAHKAGSYLIRVAFRTEYGIIHSVLSDAVTVK